MSEFKWDDESLKGLTGQHLINGKIVSLARTKNQAQYETNLSRLEGYQNSLADGTITHGNRYDLADLYSGGSKDGVNYDDLLKNLSRCSFFNKERGWSGPYGVESIEDLEARLDQETRTAAIDCRMSKQYEICKDLASKCPIPGTKVGVVTDSTSDVAEAFAVIIPPTKEGSEQIFSASAFMNDYSETANWLRSAFERTKELPIVIPTTDRGAVSLRSLRLVDPDTDSDTQSFRVPLDLTGRMLDTSDIETIQGGGISIDN
ncbi:hypothetical protein BD324DRAFT_623755 [Kockovaella imperatae]|uniref:Uncharacterized protein n=1 Tax=Kockovaella imperatae TaxID=4999 RepID=A0A1Y1UK46_9TREE|nr:hypothetical protein BD324DRAFT_623755 [Kockovaella imperatae]ORX37907.1 hypothetical protein BD324DRAFT_623755 [Kockovaella imperatae]